MVEAVYGSIGSLTLIIIMLQIDNTIISLDFLDEHFVCNLNACKGICCVEGDAGAPLEEQEIAAIQEILPLIWDDIPETSKEVIRAQGISYIDVEGEAVTSIVNGRECVLAYQDRRGVWLCSVEKAFREGRISINKPISCHLYPARVKQFKDFVAVNYHRWSICSCAVSLGNKEKVPVYQFLKEPLIRKFGQAWYDQLVIAAQELKKTQ